MQLTATHINYYHVCKRKLWLFANGINMEHTSDTVYDGKLLHQTSYSQRADRYSEIQLSATFTNPQTISHPIHLSGKIDFYNAKENVIHETKRSNKIEEAHEWQLRFYIWLLELNGVPGAQGILEYPKLRLKNKIRLSDMERTQLEEAVQEIDILQRTESCPSRIDRRICKQCSYYEFCYVGEE
mgnify:CR=1 FL=1|jgi:CRISPR-associated exonuclease Cas4